MSISSSSANATESVSKVITMENAGHCNAYELRQELTRRGAMDIPEDRINFKTLLQRMMVELVKDEEKKNEERRIALEKKQQEERDRLKEERERRKQEALERSKQRREMDPQYFEKKKSLVEEVSTTTKTNTEANADHGASPNDTVKQVEEDEEEADDTNNKPLDPFRSYQPKGRNKIFVR